MQKTKKSIAKKFKLTGSGKLMRRTPGYRHFLRSKSTSGRRSARQDKALDSLGMASQMKRYMPFA